MFTAFIILAFISLSKGQNDECSLRGECLSSVHVAGKFAPNEKECLLHCKNTTGNYFNFQVADFRDNLFFKTADGTRFTRTVISANFSKTAQISVMMSVKVILLNISLL